MTRVRPARPADAFSVCAVHGVAIREHGPAAYDDRQVAAWDRDREPSDYPVDEPGVTFLIAQRGERIGGFGEARPEADYFEAVPADYGEIRAVYVHPDVARGNAGSRTTRLPAARNAYSRIRRQRRDCNGRRDGALVVIRVSRICRVTCLRCPSETLELTVTV